MEQQVHRAGTEDTADHAFAEWQQQECSRKRRLALGIGMAMLIGYIGAIAYGHSQNAHAASSPPAAPGVAHPPR